MNCKNRNVFFALSYIGVAALFLLFVLSPIYLSQDLRELSAIYYAIVFFPLLFSAENTLSCLHLRAYDQSKIKILRSCEKIRLVSCASIIAIYAANGIGYVFARTVLGLAKNDIHPDFPRFAVGFIWCASALPFSLLIFESIVLLFKKTKHS